MKKIACKIAVFISILFFSLSFASGLAAQEALDYEFSPRDSVILNQSSICYVTTMYYGYVYDPNFEDWSIQYFYGPMGGTGFSVNPDTGHIVTAAHVIEDDYVNVKWAILDAYIFDTYPDEYFELTNNDWNWIYDNFKVEGQNKTEPDREVWVQFNTATAGLPDNPDNTYMRAEVVDSSPWDQRDIAILKVQPTTGRALSSAIVGDSSSVEVQDSLTIIGYPWNADISLESIMTPTVTSGVISARKMVSGTELLQVDGTAAPGNSGGPVLNEQGEVIGILTMGTSENINYLRPSTDILEMLNRNGVQNRLGMVDINFANGLAMYRQSHFTEAIKYFDAALNHSQGHLLAQEYKANAQAAVDRGEDMPIQQEEEIQITEDKELLQETVSPEEVFEAQEVQEAQFNNLGLFIILGALAFFLLIIIAAVVIIVVVVKKKNNRNRMTQNKVPPEGNPVKTEEKDKRYCTSCGNEAAVGQRFCANCGKQLK